MVKKPPANARDVDSIPGWEIKRVRHNYWACAPQQEKLLQGEASVP